MAEMNFSYTSYSEIEALGTVLRVSEPFRMFYRAYREEIRGELHWSLTRSNPCCLTLNPGEGDALHQIILLHRIPALPEDAAVCAHELAHAVLNSKGMAGCYVPVQAAPPSAMLGQVLNELVSAPLIVAMLAKHGFDVLGHWPRYTPDTYRRVLGTNRQPPSGAWLKLASAIDILADALCYEALTGDQTFDGVLDTFCETFKDVGEMVVTVNEQIRGIGYDTPQKQARLLQFILHRYAVPDLSVVYSNSDGLTIHDNNPTPVFARWPGAAPGQGNISGEATGIITENELTALTEVGLYGALEDGVFVDENLVMHFAPRVTIRVPGSYDFLDFYGEWIELPFATNIRGIDLSAYRFELVRASITYVNGTAECEFELQAETHGQPGVADPQEQKDVDVVDPDDVWPVFEFPVFDGSDLIAGAARLALLYGSSLVYTTDHGVYWTHNTLPVVSGDTLVDGVQKPGTATTVAAAGRTTKYVFTDVIGNPTVLYSHAFRKTAGVRARALQIERGNASIHYVLSYYDDGLWSEGSLDGGATQITAVRIGTNTDLSGRNTPPPLYVDPNNPLIAYTIAPTVSGWRLHKTTDGGLTWSATTDYRWNASATNVGCIVGADFFTYGTFIERSFDDPSVMYICARGVNGDFPVVKATATTSEIISPLYSGSCGSFPRWTGSMARRGFRSVDGAANKLLMVTWRDVGFGAFDWGIFKSVNAGGSFTQIVAESGTHNTMPGGVVGGDRKAVWVWKFGDLLYHPNFDALTSGADFTSLAGTNFPTTSQAINLFGF